MNIADSTYAALPSRNRIQATISALARDDGKEVDRLRKSCPKVACRCNEDSYSDGMTLLMNVSLGLESDLRGLCIDYLRIERTSGNEELLKLILSHLASEHQAWLNLLARLGIDPEEMAKAGAPRHEFVKDLLTRAQGRADSALVAAMDDLYASAFT